MIEDMKEILLIAPYEKMYNLALRIIQEMHYDCEIEVVWGDLEDGVNRAVSAMEGSTKVIISRGGTYRMIQEMVSGPVVEIRSSLYDTINTLSQVIKNPVPLAIVGFSNIVDGYDLDFLQTILKTKVRKVDLSSGQDVEETIRHCVKDGFTTFLGDAVVQKVCQRLGYQSYLQESGRKALLSAIEEARRILHASKQEIELAKRLRAVIDFVHDGIIATDNNDTVIICNAIAQDLVGVRREDLLGRNVREVVTTFPLFQGMFSTEETVDRIMTSGDSVFSVTNIPVAGEGESFGSLTIIRDVRELQDYEKKVRLIMSDKGFVARHTFDSIIYRSREMEHCIAIAKKFSHYDASVLLEGNSGVGKELFAQSIHNESYRRSGPFVAVNCATLPKSLIESELFGYVEGAFTGSRRGGKAGYFEMAHKGSLLLDEIGELPIEVQGQLLRVIQEKEIMRLGDTRIIPVDVRLICATNRNLSEMVQDGSFRKDLLYRINTLSLYIAPLSRRPDDIMVLALHFLDMFCKKYAKKIDSFSPRSTEYLENYEYDGNVRELRGMIERAVIICEGTMIRLSDLQDGKNPSSDVCIRTTVDTGTAVDTVCEGSLEFVENRHIRDVFEKTGRSVGKTAEILGISRTTVWRKLRAIDVP